MLNLKAGAQLICFNKAQITSNNVIKAESLYQLIYFRYLLLQVNVNWRNYKFYVDIYIYTV